jgi:hypothetical protein
MTSISSSWNIAMEVPGFNFPTANATDQVARQQGIFARGHLGVLQYRVAMNKPFVARSANIPATTLLRAFDKPAETYAYNGYFSLNFKYREDDQAFPFARFAYLGTKKIFNVGWGFHYHPKSLESRDLAGAFQTHNKLLMGYDVFIEQPFANKSAFTMYGVFYDFRFGPNYIRSLGSGNYHVGGAINGEPLPQGGGNSEFFAGTGKIGYVMLAYLLPPKLMKTQGKWQIYGTASYKDFEALAEPSFQWGTGINYYMFTRNLKLTGAYQTRTIYQGTVGYKGTAKAVDSKGVLSFMMQLII